MENDDPYERFVLDVGGTCNWQRNPSTGQWTGRAIGERYYFNIVKEDGVAVGLDFSGMSRYETTPAAEGIYMYDFYWENLPLCQPLQFANP